VQGKLPERRSNHAAFIWQGSISYFYVHGGRDLKEGALDNMWRLNIDELDPLERDPYYPLHWEPVTVSGAGPGKISHHTCATISSQMVLFGGQIGIDDNSAVYTFDLPRCTWSRLEAGPGVPQPRDDHVLVQLNPDESSLLIFGGFVNGSRVNEVYEMRIEGEKVEFEKHEPAGGLAPEPRASHLGVPYNNKLYIFGGQGEDNNKLNDLWEFTKETNTWWEIHCAEGDYIPVGRSGGAGAAWNGKLYIFGGILEITKELNDMIVFDFATGKFETFERDESPASHHACASLKVNTKLPKENEGGHSFSPYFRKRAQSPRGGRGISPIKMGSPSPQGRDHSKGKTQGLKNQTTVKGKGD